jgi:hypothetical protein
MLAHFISPCVVRLGHAGLPSVSWKKVAGVPSVDQAGVQVMLLRRALAMQSERL